MIGDILHFLVAVIVCALVGYGAALCIVWAIDKEQEQVAEGIKDVRTCILPIIEKRL